MVAGDGAAGRRPHLDHLSQRVGSAALAGILQRAIDDTYVKAVAA
jgi:hypothetical protein